MKSLPIWIFWLLASMAVGGMIGVLLSGGDLAFSFEAILMGGFPFVCFSLWRNW
jgi:hypothetical protein